VYPLLTFECPNQSLWNSACTSWHLSHISFFPFFVPFPFLLLLSLSSFPWIALRRCQSPQYMASGDRITDELQGTWMEAKKNCP
jgi:hypothetical protein